MYWNYKRIFLLITCAFAGDVPGNLNNVINVPSNIPAIPGFGSKNDTGGTTTVMGNFDNIIPGFLQNGKNETVSDGGNSNNGGNFATLISGIPNKIFPNKTGNNGIPGFGNIPGLPNVFENSKNNSGNSNGGIPNFGSIIPGFFGNKNKTNSGNENESGNGSDSNNGFPDITSYIPGIPNKNKTCGSTNGLPNSGIPFIGCTPSLPNNIFGTNKTDTGVNLNLNALDFGAIPDKVFVNDIKNKTVVKRHCKERHEHKEAREHDEDKERDKRQIGSGLGSLGSLIPGGSDLSSIGSALGSADTGEATLIAGAFQVVVKPIKTPSLNTVTDVIKNPQAGVSDLIKNPQNILTQPQTLLNGGK